MPDHAEMDRCHRCLARRVLLLYCGNKRHRPRADFPTTSDGRSTLLVERLRRRVVLYRTISARRGGAGRPPALHLSKHQILPFLLALRGSAAYPPPPLLQHMILCVSYPLCGHAAEQLALPWATLVLRDKYTAAAAAAAVAAAAAANAIASAKTYRQKQVAIPRCRDFQRKTNGRLRAWSSNVEQRP